MEHFLKNRAPSNLPHLLLSMDEPIETERLGSAQIFVILEKDVLCECQQPQTNHSVITSSLITLLSVYYALNLQYGDTEKNMFKFLEEHVLGLAPKRKSYVLKKIENKLLSKLRLNTSTV